MLMFDNIVSNIKKWMKSRGSSRGMKLRGSKLGLKETFNSVVV